MKIKQDIPSRFPRLFSLDNAKAAKASGYGCLNAIHYMAPYNSAGVGNLCVKSSPGCRLDCLGLESGHAAMVKPGGTNSVRESRKLKARLFMAHRADYLNRLARDILRVERKAKREGLQPVIRLNGSTDIAFERMRFDLDSKTIAAMEKRAGKLERPERVTLHELFHWIQFVDYTKIYSRLGNAPANLSLTFSRSEINESECMKALAMGQNVAIVFGPHVSANGSGLPDSWRGFHVINGDSHDLRHLDPQGVVVGLSPKGAKAKADSTGFVVRQAPLVRAMKPGERALIAMGRELELELFGNVIEESMLWN